MIWGGGGLQFVHRSFLVTVLTECDAGARKVGAWRGRAFKTATSAPRPSPSSPGASSCTPRSRWIPSRRRHQPNIWQPDKKGELIRGQSKTIPTQKRVRPIFRRLRPLLLVQPLLKKMNLSRGRKNKLNVLENA